MFADFKISPTGDIILSEDTQGSRLSLSFYTCKYKGQRISMFIENDKCNSIESSLKLSFNIEKQQKKYEVPILKNNEALAQLISVKLRTPIGSLAERQWFGSTVMKYNHSNSDTQTIENVQKLIKKELEDIINKPVVKITTKTEKIYGYRQFLEVKIYDEDKLLLTENIK